MRLHRTNGALRLDLQGEAIRLRQGDSGLALRLKLDAAEEGTSWRAKISNGHCVNDTVELTPKDDGVTMLIPLEEQYLFEAGTLYVSVAAVKNDCEQWSNSVGITVAGKTNCCAGRRPVTPPEMLRGTLTFTGAVSAEYDGSMDVVVNIPPGGSGDTADAERTVWYGECSTAAATDEKTVTVGDGFTLAEGVTVCIRFAKPNTSVTPMLNVNGTGAKSLVNSANLAPVNEWGYNYYVFAVYNGTQWVMTTPTDAGKTNKGIVNLSNDYSATGDVVAASTAAVRNALAAAKEYADSKVSSGGGGSDIEIDTTLTKSGAAADAKATGDALAKKADTTAIPTALKNPYGLRFTGATKATYDGSASLTVNIPNGSTTGATPTIVNTDGNITASDIYALADGEYWFAKPFEQDAYMTGASLIVTTNTLLVGYVLCASHVMYCQATGYSVNFVHPTTVGGNDHAESGTVISELPPLPVVTTLDSGKVLTVNSSGEWEAVTPETGSSVTLSSATDSTSETTAATSKAVSDALTAAKAYADELIGGIENGTY